MAKNPTKLILQVVANLHKEGRWWVAECPALDLATQGKTRSEARAMLEEAASLTVDVHMERGTLSAALLKAMQHPSSRAKPVGETLSMDVPLDLLAARHVQEARNAA